MVFDMVERLKVIWPIRDGPTIDDRWDHLNRNLMFLMLCLFGICVTLRQFTGNTIACTGFTKFSEDFADDYCWTQGLYTMWEAYDMPRDQAPYPGIIPEDITPCQERELTSGGRIVCPDIADIKPPRRIYHLWYQWIAFYFWMVATLYGTPYLILKQLGLGHVKSVVSMLHNPMQTEDELRKTICKASTWLYYHMDVYRKKKTCFALSCQTYKLAVVIVLVKCLYLIITVASFCLTARMFKLGNYLTYGYDWIVSMYQDEDDASTLVRHRFFPKMIACEIRRWGTTGIENEQGMCVLAPNVIYQYLFLILWFAYIILINLNAISLLLVLVKYPLVSFGYRRFIMKSFVKDAAEVKKMYEEVGTSGRIILHILATNVQPKIFEAVVDSFTHKFLHSGPGGGPGPSPLLTSGPAGVGSGKHEPRAPSAPRGNVGSAGVAAAGHSGLTGLMADTRYRLNGRQP